MTGTQYTTNYINLNSDKISSSVEGVELFSDAKWPIYFSTGEREIGDQVITRISEEAQKKISINCYPTTFTDNVSVVLDQRMTSGINVELINSLAQRVYAFTTQPSRDGSILLNFENLHAGNYFLRISNAQRIGGCRILKK
jgi:hypothetical protein